MNKQRRVGRRSVVLNLVKPNPSEFYREDKVSIGPKRSLFGDDASFIMKHSLKPLHEINDLQYSLTKSKSHSNLYEEMPCQIPKYPFTDVNKHERMILSPPNRIGHNESCMVKNRREPNEPIFQSRDLFNALIDSPCTKFEKLQYNNALLSASKFLLNHNLESVQQNVDLFKEVPEVNSREENEKPSNEYKTSHLIDLSITTKKNDYQSDYEIKTSSRSLYIDEIEELKKREIEDTRQSKLQFCDTLKAKFKKMELEIEKHFDIVESKVTGNFNQLLKKIKDGKHETSDSQTLDTTVKTVTEKNYTRMTGEEINILNADCSSMKTPKIKDKTCEEILTNSDLTPGTMAFVRQERLMHLNNNF